MLGHAVETDVASTAQLVSGWDRLLLSLPHAGGFSAFYGKFDFSSRGPNQEYDYLLTVAMLAAIPIISFWLYFVHDMLRNTFLRVGHMGMIYQIKHNIIYSLVFLFPLVFIGMAMVPQSKENAGAILLVGAMLFSWMFCAVLAANSIYLKAAKILGIMTND
jgi:hypothetical protein